MSYVNWSCSLGKINKAFYITRNFTINGLMLQLSRCTTVYAQLQQLDSNGVDILFTRNTI